MKQLLTAAALAALATAAVAQPAPGGPALNLDRDHDGKVTFAEFQAGQSARTDRMFALLDADKDGKITQAEASALSREPAPSAKAPQGPAGGRFLMRMDANGDGAVTRAEMDATAKRRFDAADSNKDGWLSKGELILMRQRMQERGGAS